MATAPHRPLILAVDDVADNLRALGTLLSREPVEIALASNGPDALAAAKADPPNLVLLDVMMPGMDGYEVCRRLKADLQFANLPIIFLTARAETEDVVKGFAVGCVDYVTKPFREAELLARVRTQLQLHQLRSLLAICMYCHNIRGDDSQWERLDSYIAEHTAVKFSHSICPACMALYHPDMKPRA